MPNVFYLFLIVLVLWALTTSALGMVFWGTRGDMAYVCERDRGPLIEFCVEFKEKR